MKSVLSFIAMLFILSMTLVASYSASPVGKVEYCASSCCSFTLNQCATNQCLLKASSEHVFLVFSLTT